MATQYTLDVALAASASDTNLQYILSYLNPTIGAMSDAALQAFQSQLENLAPANTGMVYLEGVKVDPASVSAAPLFDINALGSANAQLDAGAGHDTLTGGANDTIYGSTSTTGGASIQGAAGDIIYGGAGSDTINAGTGNETIVAGDGASTITGSSSYTGHALIIGGSGKELIRAGQGSDTIDAGSGATTIDGGSGSSTIHGGSGNDVINAGSGASTIYAGSGHDTVYGGNAGNTTFVVTAATFNNDVFTGGLGQSILDLSDLNQNNVNISTTSGVTTVDFGSKSLTLTNVNQIDFANGSKMTLH
jgi:Ca2+-binding RTX toxin-like protein